MAKYATLKAAVQAAIKTNGAQQITGQVLQTQLVNMITSLGKYFQSFGGLATPAGSFSAGDESVTFLAVEAGTYTNFGGAVLDGKTLHILAYDGDWADVDTLIPSGAAFEAALALAIKGSQSGIAEGIADTISAGTAQEFLQRQSGGDGVNCLKRIKGKTIAWNQLVTDGNFSQGTMYVTPETSAVSINVSNGVLSVQTSAARAGVFLSSVYVIVGHRYYVSFDYTSSSELTLRYGSSINVPATNQRSHISSILDASASASLNIFPTPATAGTYEFTLANVFIVDLTLLGLGDLTAAQFEALYPALYYPYNPGVLKSNDAAALLTDGFNQWDEEWENGAYDSNGQKLADSSKIRSKNFIPIFPNTVYYAKTAGENMVIGFYDANKNYLGTGSAAYHKDTIFTTPANAYFATFWMFTTYGATYKNDICINLSWSGYRNGEYEPYWQRVLALRLSELTGIPEGGTEADRVTMFPNGAGGAGSAFDSIFVENGVTKARKTMGRVDLGTLTWNIDAATYRVVGFLPASAPAAKNYSVEQVADIICDKYTANSVQNIYSSASAQGNIGLTTTISINDSALYSLSSGEAVKTAVSGIYLYYPLATPIVYTDLQYADGTPFTMPATILVDNYGTERIQAPEGATTPSAPFCCDSNYSIGVANLVKRLAALENAE